ncbi:MAG: UDP-N-acetylmuramoyl-L-alanyl-D-glutamate--2,6-diaminopimelate ligase [Anaerovoracaceae bacterium]
MKQLKMLLEKIDYTCIQGNDQIEISELVYDSRQQCEKGVFVCINGSEKNGIEFLREVVEKGIRAIVIDQDIEIIKEVEKTLRGITLIKVHNARVALAYMSAAYFDYPAEHITTIGVTGTKGKTTTTYMIKAILENIGVATGLIGTIEVSIGDEKIGSENTTPESWVIQKYLRKMVDKGLQAVVMEVSSQGLMLHRVDGILFDYGVFTNIGKDHIGKNEHKDFDEYIKCKSMLFRQCKKAIVNRDDEHLEQVLYGHTCQVETFGIIKEANFRGTNIELYHQNGILGVIYNLSGNINMKVLLEIPGRFSIYNSLAAIGVCSHFSSDKDAISKGIMAVKVRGRVELIPFSKDFSVILDYAHNAMALESLLVTLREYKPKRLVCVFGCGGNRDRNRRFEMGEISSKLADLTVVTSDNPRNEKPEAIIQDIISGVERQEGKYVAIIDRIQGITYAIKNAQVGDVIVIAGKGHEDYQIIGNTKYHLDDKEIILSIK